MDIEHRQEVFMSLFGCKSITREMPILKRCDGVLHMFQSEQYKTFFNNLVVNYIERRQTREKERKKEQTEQPEVNKSDNC